jgi:hypothetical protein
MEHVRAVSYHRTNSRKANFVFSRPISDKELHDLFEAFREFIEQAQRQWAERPRD